MYALSVTLERRLSVFAAEAGKIEFDREKQRTAVVSTAADADGAACDCGCDASTS